MIRHALIIGATSGIAEATARRWAERGDALYLVARDSEHLARIAADLATRGAARVEQASLDVLDFDSHPRVLEDAFQAMQTIDTVLIAHGSGSNEHECLHDTQALKREFDINATATIALLAQLATRLRNQGHGNLAVLSSVAGDRGRRANMLYGAAKAAVDAYTSGLRQRLVRTQVNVLTIKPGWVDTPMTAAMQPNALFATPERVAKDIVNAIDKRRAILYTPWYWRPIMLALRCVPEALWRHLRF